MSNKIFKSILPILLVVLMVGVGKTSSAQDWYKAKKVGIYSVGLGGTQGIVVGNGGYYGTASSLSSLGLSINVSGEYRVHDYIGVGFESGINFLIARGGYYYSGYTSLEIPFIAKANFHILEVTSVSIKDRLDVYAGLSFGGGPAFGLGSASGSGVVGVIHVGPQVGARYWINDRIGVFSEFGWGATFVNGGITF